MALVAVSLGIPRRQDFTLDDIITMTGTLTSNTGSMPRTMRIRQEGIFLTNLLKDVASGVLAPAAFQRPYVWQASDVLALCDSVLAGYPIGSFMIWEPHASVDLAGASRNRLGPIPLTNTRRNAGLILDGQNRLASFAWMTYDPATPLPTDLSEAETRTWASGMSLVADLAMQEIRFVATSEAAKGFMVPAHTLVSGQANDIIRKRWEHEWKHFSETEKDVGVMWFDRACDSFREARVTATIMQNATTDEARRAFLQICKVGVPISAEDFDAVTKWDRIEGPDAGVNEEGEMLEANKP